MTNKIKIRNYALILLILIILSWYVFAVPNPDSFDSYTNSSLGVPNVTQSSAFNSTGGSIYLLSINVTTQNLRWKGYVGNIYRDLSLQDASSNSIFDWELSTISGEIYATRNSSIPAWSSIQCAQQNVITADQIALNITSSAEDSIENTFNSKNHNQFYTGITLINTDSCDSVSLNVNGTNQSDKFQEVLLSDTNSLIFASLLENSTFGFNNQTYDFQMILPASALDGNPPNVAYYFYIELI